MRKLDSIRRLAREVADANDAVRELLDLPRPRLELLTEEITQGITHGAAEGAVEPAAAAAQGVSYVDQLLAAKEAARAMKAATAEAMSAAEKLGQMRELGNLGSEALSAITKPLMKLPPS